jgi:hypothetical protein
METSAAPTMAAAKREVFIGSSLDGLASFAHGWTDVQMAKKGRFVDQSRSIPA